MLSVVFVMFNTHTCRENVNAVGWHCCYSPTTILTFVVSMPSCVVVFLSLETDSEHFQKVAFSLVDTSTESECLKRVQPWELFSKLPFHRLRVLLSCKRNKGFAFSLENVV